MKRFGLLVLFLALGGLLLALPPMRVDLDVDDVTQAEFERLREGMTYEDCVGIIGREGTPFGTAVAPDAPTDEVEWVSYVWRNSKSSFVEANFRYGRLYKKRAEGLE